MEPINKALLAKRAVHQGRNMCERRCSLVTRKSDGRALRLRAKTTYKENQTDRIAPYTSAGYQRRHDEKGKTSTGETLPAQTEKSVVKRR